MTSAAEDPGIYVTGVWPRLDAYRRRIVAATIDPDGSVEAWSAILAQDDREVVALALDLRIGLQALSRWAATPVSAADAIRAAAVRLIEAPPFDTSSRFGQTIAAGSHVVAFRALAHSAMPADATLLACTAPDASASAEMKRAWIVASAETLRRAGQPIASLVDALLTLAENVTEQESIAAEAITALGEKPGAGAEPRLHAIVEKHDGDRRIEAVIALGAADMLRGSEYSLIEAWLTRPHPEGLLAQRIDELRAILDRKAHSS